MSELIRINKYIASSSKYSRRDVDKMILDGRIAVNGELIKEQGVKINPELDAITVDDIPLIEEDVHIYKFYKPRGVLTAYGDGFGKDTLDIFSELKLRKLPYSGRLDFESEGLLIFSNDGELIQRLQRPEKKIEKEYLVTVDRLLTEEEENDFKNGLETTLETYLPCKLNKINRKEYSVIITQGKKRQIRLMFGYFGVTVKKLVRIRIANILLDDLQQGELRAIDKFDLRELKKYIGM